MRLLRVVAGLLALMLLAFGCTNGETDDAELLQRTSAALSGGAWENADDPGDALIFRPNGTGYSYFAVRDLQANITWSMTLEDGHVVLSWSHQESDAEDVQEWVIEIDDDTMLVWPIEGSPIVLDPNEDRPIELTRIE